MADPELEAIRQRRMAEMMAKQGGGMPMGGGGGMQDAAAQEERKREVEEKRQAMLHQLLLPEARERLSRIALVKPDKARGIEDMIIRAAQAGRIGERISEDRLIGMLEQLNETQGRGPKVTMVRRKSAFDDDD
eukprot:jgi/Mesvir1/12060/Mv00346-RA.1